MADKPARALVIYGDGLAGALGPEQKDLHALALSGSCGFLALRENPVRGQCSKRVCTEVLFTKQFSHLRNDRIRRVVGLTMSEHSRGCHDACSEGVGATS